MELSYESIAKMLDGDVFGAAINEDGERVILQWERIPDQREGCDGYDGSLEEPEGVYTASWVSKRNERGEWWVTHTYHEDGTVEETFDYEEVQHG